MGDLQRQKSPSNQIELSTFKLVLYGERFKGIVCGLQVAYRAKSSIDGRKVFTLEMEDIQRH